ncbi:MAG: glycosyltransferase family 39 protein [Burkholderiales bacterium]|nr:glycosyltransferase family 39 protein [Burkholderiales bacterium]
MPMHVVQEPLARSRLLLLLLAVAVVWFGNLEYRKLFHPDEGRYAEIPREMVASADWLTPRLNGIKYFEKPPLQYWATAAAYRVFGEAQWTSRLWTALSGFLAVLLTYAAGLRLSGPDAGLYAALLLVSSAGFVLGGHYNTLDMGLTFFLTLALVAFLFAQRDHQTRRGRALWMHVAWAAAAGAVLSKGLVGAVLPAGGLVAYTLLTRDFAVWRRLNPVTGVLLFLALAAPWFVQVSLANPEFPRYFFIHEHFQRFLTTAHYRDQPWWFFLPVLVLGLLPWTTLVPGALAQAWRSESDGSGFRARRFLLAYAGFILLFFSASSSKLEAYVLPMLPAIALLLGERVAALQPGRLRRHLVFALTLGLIVLAAPIVLRRFGPVELAALPETFDRWLQAAGAVLAAGAAGALHLAGRGRPRGAVVVAALAALVAAQFGNSGAEALSPARSGYDLAVKIAPLLRPDTPFYSFGMYEQTIPFYLKRKTTLVGSAEEMAFGLGQEPQLWIGDPRDFEPRWRSEPGALAIMRPVYFDLLAKFGVPMRVVANDDRYVVVTSP